MEKIAKQLDEIHISPIFNQSAKTTLQNVLGQVFDSKAPNQFESDNDEEDTGFRDNLKIILNTMVDEIWKQKRK
jgi:hypothetical protein